MRTPRTEESRRKSSESLKRWCAANPDRLRARGAKIRGEKNIRWKGGASKLNKSVRQMTENRRWMDAVKARDGKCVRCGSTDGLEAHHVRPLYEIVAALNVGCRDDARTHAMSLWDLANGKTLCGVCHYAEHGRTGPPTTRATVFKSCLVCEATFTARPSMASLRKCCSRACLYVWRMTRDKGSANPNWKGGLVQQSCRQCGNSFNIKPAKLSQGQGAGTYCSLECRYAPR